MTMLAGLGVLTLESGRSSASNTPDIPILAALPQPTPPEHPTPTPSGSRPHRVQRITKHVAGKPPPGSQ
jgi:hypothetical protein